MRKQLVLVLGCLGMALCIHCPAETLVVYPAPESSRDNRYADLIMLLKIALDRTVPEYGHYRLLPSATPMNEARAFSELRAHGSINLLWSSTSRDKEREFLAIRFPLRKDLLGYRILLTNTKSRAKVAQIRTLENLRQLTLGQGVGWGDLEVYQANRIPVVSADYESLFPMVTNNRFDAIPRGVNEVFDEFARRAETLDDLQLDPKIALYYPWPYYFFVDKDSPELAKRIELGLCRMLADGSFDQVFWQFNGAAIRQADLAHRHLIRLNNPLLPEDSPVWQHRFQVYPEVGMHRGASKDKVCTDDGYRLPTPSRH